MLRSAFIILLTSLILSCSSYPSMKPVCHVDLDRFMGDWYVIANIPTFIEVDAHNAVESYRLNEDGSIATTFTYRDGGFEGEQKTWHPTGYVLDKDTNAVWGMQFIWPIKADYRIVYLSKDYNLTVIARKQRDYVWIMSRSPSIADNDYQMLIALLDKLGYDTTKVKMVPQKW